MRTPTGWTTTCVCGTQGLDAMKAKTAAQRQAEVLHIPDAGPMSLARWSATSGYQFCSCGKWHFVTLAPADEIVHASDCALHNEPAYPAGPCDCGAGK